MYGPLMHRDAVVIIADIWDHAKLVEQAIRMAGIQVPIYGASSFFESAKTRAQGAALHSARNARTVMEDMCGVHLPKVEALPKVQAPPNIEAPPKFEALEKDQYCLADDGKSVLCEKLLGPQEL